MKNDIYARHSRTGNVTAEDSHDSLHVTPHYIRLVILNFFNEYLKCQCLMKVFGRKFFSEWIINECVVSISVTVSRYRIRSISFCLDVDLTYVTTLIFKNNIRSCARLDSIVMLF